MLRLPHGTSLALISWRRTAVAALIALQAVIAVSPVLERRDEVRRDTHVEAQGNRHLFGHDESTCGVCAVRIASGAAPEESPALVATATRGKVEIAYATVVLPSGTTADNPPRAPPVLG